MRLILLVSFRTESDFPEIGRKLTLKLTHTRGIIPRGNDDFTGLWMGSYFYQNSHVIASRNFAWFSMTKWSHIPLVWWWFRGWVLDLLRPLVGEKHKRSHSVGFVQSALVNFFFVRGMFSFSAPRNFRRNFSHFLISKIITFPLVWGSFCGWVLGPKVIFPKSAENSP